MPYVELKQVEELSYAKKEAFKTLRTNLGFCGEEIKVIIFTSCMPDEGKSTVVMDLARTTAENNKKVLVIDADLRKSILVGRYNVKLKESKKGEKSESGDKSHIEGLTHFLAGKTSMENVICNTNIENMDVIFAGHMTPNPTELLDNSHFTKLLEYAREKYDMVLIDCPPLGSVIDAAVIAPKADGAVIVLEAGRYTHKLAVDIKRQLNVTGIRILGTVINKVQVEHRSYYYKGYYKSYSKYYGDEEQ